MTHDPICKDPAFQAMTMDILNNVLSSADNPLKLVKYLSEELRELTGARCIMFIQCIKSTSGVSHRVVDVNPSRYSGWTESPAALRLYEVIHELPGTQLQRPDDSLEASGLLHEAGFELSIFVPLNVGDDRVGAMLVLGLPDELHIETEIRLLNTLATIVALVLRNAFLFERQEQVIKERTIELQKSNDLLKAIVDGTTDIILVKDRESRYHLFNKAASKLFGVSSDEILGKAAHGLIPDQEAEIVMAHDRKVIADVATHTFEEVVTTKDGVAHTLLSTKGPLFDDNGDVNGLFSISRDITERIEIEKALKESEARLRFALEGSNEGLWDVQMKTGKVYISPRGCEILGYKQDELEQVIQVWSDLVHPDDLPLTNERLQAHLEGRTPLFEIEQRLRMKSGNWKWVLTRGKMFSNGQDDASLRMTGTHTDISERKHLEDQLRQSQKMEAIGQLAGGVAHDFNNILQVIMGYASMLSMGATLNDRHKEAAEQIIASSEKAAQLTRGLLAFSRKQIMNPQNANINDIVEHVQKFLGRIIGEDIQFKSILSGMKLPVTVDSGQIEQVLINLATNARDAMPKGGMLTIETGFQEIYTPLEHAHGYGEPGRYAWIAVSDTGSGMDEETRGRIFEPFFTTKEIGKGTGLGMAIVYGIVRQHNGFINVYSEPGHGTTFRVYLPIAETGPAEQREKVGQALPQGGTETILLAEDDPSVRKLVVALLTKFGYDVIQAEDGEEAVGKFAANRDRISLILMDMIMPKKNGREAYEEIRKLEPSVKIIYTSGYTADFIQSRGALDEGIELIMKPVQPMELLRKVREKLGALETRNI